MRAYANIDRANYSAKSKKNMKVVFISASIIALLSLILLWTNLIIWQNNKTENILKKQLTTLSNDFTQNNLETTTAVLKKITKSPLIQQSLTGAENRAETELYLNGIATGSNANMAYVLNSSGIAIASSKNDNGTSFIDKNYAFRPYFKIAIKGAMHIQTAVGVLTGQRGFYISMPIYNKSYTEVIGVAVLKKTSIEYLEKKLRQQNNPIAVITQNNIIFASNDNDLLFRSMSPKSNSEIEDIEASRQFGSIKILPPPKSVIYNDKDIDITTLNQLSITIKVDNSDWFLTTWYKKEIPITLGLIWSCTIIVAILLLSFILIAIQDRIRNMQVLEEYSKTTDRILNSANIARWEIRFNEGRLIANDEKEGVLSNIYHNDRHIMNIDLAEAKTKQSIIDIQKNILALLAKRTISRKFQNQFYHIDAGFKWIETQVLFINKIDDSSGTISGIFIDIDKEKKADIKANKHMEELEKSLLQLKEAQVQLVETEKQASLGRLVCGIAHEINTPLGLAITYNSFMHDKVTTLMDDYAKGIFKRSSFEKFNKIMLESIEDSLFNLKRAGELVQDFKQVAVDQNIERLQVFYLNEYTNKVIHSIKGKWKNSPYTVTVNQPENDIKMHSYPGAIMQILTNLIENAINHGFKNQQKGQIEITVNQRHEHSQIIVVDDGQGMNEEILSKMFDPFFTTNMGGGGTGLGAHIVYNLVTQTLNGTLNCHSEPDKGTRFEILIPNNIEKVV